MKRKYLILGALILLFIAGTIFAICEGNDVFSIVSGVASIIGVLWLVIDVVKKWLSKFSKENHYLSSTLPKKADSSNVIGRDEDLKKLWKLLSDSKHEQHLVMLTGFAGIGKTKLAQMLFHKYEKKFDEVAWIDYQGNMRKSISSINLEQLKGIDDEEKRWKALAIALNNDKKKKLFVIDNVDSEGEQQPSCDTCLQELTGWKNITVLLTSRMKGLEDFQTFGLGRLNKEDCIKLFNHYYYESLDTVRQVKKAPLELVTKLVELADCHTLTIELLAKAARPKDDLEKYYNEVKTGFEKADEEFSTGHHPGEEGTMAFHLQSLFKMQNRKPKEKKVLNSFAILPVNFKCQEKELEDWFGFKTSDCSALIRDGWLQHDKNRRVYSLHPLVRTIVRFSFQEDKNHNKTIAPRGTADKVLGYFENNEGWYQISNQGYLSLQRMMGVVESVLGAAVQKENEHFTTVYFKLGYAYDDLGDFGKALVYYFKAKEIREKVLGTENKDTADTYNDIGTVYHDQGEYDKALEYHQKALTIREKVLGTEHSSTAISYNNIGSVYWKKGEYGEALEYYFKALAIYEKVLGTAHPWTATTYNNIGTVYKKQGNYGKALDYFFKALPIVEKNLGPNHPNTASSYNNIGGVYKEQGNYGKALEYYLKALAIKEKVLGTEHPSTATSYNNIGVVYYEHCNYPKALDYLNKAYQIRLKVLGPEHPDTKDMLVWIKNVKKAEKKTFWQRLFGK